MRTSLVAFALVGTLALQSPLAQARHGHGEAVAAGILGFLAGAALAGPPHHHHPPRAYYPSREVVVIERYPPPRHYKHPPKRHGYGHRPYKGYRDWD